MLTTQHHSITEITRRDIRRSLVREGIWWSGELDEVEFLNRLYDLDSLPSTDSRFSHAAGDIWQHRINNLDWDDWWIFSDERLQLADGPDEVFLQFLAEMVHPVVRADRDQAKAIVTMLNQLLAPDGWELAEKSTISGRSIYGPRRLTTSQHAIRTARIVAARADADYVHRQINRMESALESDPDPRQSHLNPREIEDELFQDGGGEGCAVAFTAEIVFDRCVRREDGYGQAS